MSDSFNGYHVWLGIPPHEQPPNHYRLLGIPLLETDRDVIDHAADRQMAHVRTFQSGRHQALSQQILNELAAARLCLLNPERKSQYDERLRAQLDDARPAATAVPIAKPLPTATPVAAAVPVAAPLVGAISAGARAGRTAASAAAPVAVRLTEVSVVEELDALDNQRQFELGPAGAPSLRTRLRRRGYLGGAAWYRPALLGLLAAATITTLVLLLYFVRWLANNDWRQYVDFSVFEPQTPAGSPSDEPPQAEAPPAPPEAAPPLPGARPTL